MIRRLVPLVLAAGLAACNTSANYFQDEESGETDTNAVSSLLTMSGMLAAPKAPIEYAPRAPLAMPGTSELPQPADRSAAMDAVDFPVDQDEQHDAALARLREGSKKLDQKMARDLSNSVDARALPGDIQATMPTATPTSRPDHGNRPADARKLSREEMAVTVKNPNRAALLAEDGTAAPRQSLSVPPGDYRTPVATAALPEADKIEHSDWIAKQLYQRDDRRPARMQGSPNNAGVFSASKMVPR